MPNPHVLSPSLATAALVALAVFSTTACSTTTDPTPASVSMTDAGNPAPRNPESSGTGNRDSTDSSSSGDSASTDAREFSMHPGDSVDLAGNGSLRYLRTVNDSRCMPDVQCIWAGDAELSFQWQKPSAGQETFSLHTGTRVGSRDHVIGEQRVTLQSLARGPAPEAQLRVEPNP